LAGPSGVSVSISFIDPSGSSPAGQTSTFRLVPVSVVLSVTYS
jgi:hypothetical protein